MNNGSWDIGIWLKKAVEDAAKNIVSLIGKMENKVEAFTKQEETNSQTINKGIQESTESILTAVEGIQNLFKSASEANLEPSEAIEGKTFFDGTVLKTGTMKNNAGVTVEASSETYDGTNLYLGIPIRALYDKSSKIYTKNASIVRCLGDVTSFDVSDIPGYQNLTIDNFVLGIDAIKVSPYANVNGSNIGSNGAKPTISYEPSTGKGTVTGTTITASASFGFNAAYPYGHGYSDHTARGGATVTITYKVYLVIGGK